MNARRRVRTMIASIAAGAVLVAGSLFGATSAQAAPPPPAKMAAIGDSISLATMSCSALLACSANSWSTGTAITSHAQRLKALNPALTAYNDAVVGTMSAGLTAQAQKAVSQGAQYVTVEIGANDACTKTVGAMTPTATFATNVQSALSTLAGSGAQIFVASIPNLWKMWDVNKGSVSARLTWGLLQTCQSLLANPSSTKQADIDRRAAVQARVGEYNAALQAACAATTNCRFDNNVVANYSFSAAQVSTRDYFHPSVSGQQILADITWAQSQWVS